MSVDWGGWATTASAAATDEEVCTCVSSLARYDSSQEHRSIAAEDLPGVRDGWIHMLHTVTTVRGLEAVSDCLTDLIDVYRLKGDPMTEVFLPKALEAVCATVQKVGASSTINDVYVPRDPTCNVTPNGVSHLSSMMHALTSFHFVAHLDANPVKLAWVRLAESATTFHSVQECVGALHGILKHLPCCEGVSTSFVSEDVRVAIAELSHHCHTENTATTKRLLECLTMIHRSNPNAQKMFGTTEMRDVWVHLSRCDFSIVASANALESLTTHSEDNVRLCGGSAVHDAVVHLAKCSKDDAQIVAVAYLLVTLLGNGHEHHHHYATEGVRDGLIRLANHAHGLQAIHAVCTAGLQLADSAPPGDKSFLATSEMHEALKRLRQAAPPGDRMVKQVIEQIERAGNGKKACVIS
eukprot:PhM_4_TR793/c0_g1_i1/m.12098